MKKTLLVLLLPFYLYAGGIGISLPVTFLHTSSADYSPDYGGADYEGSFDYDPTIGIGISYETNLAQEGFGYRINLEVSQEKAKPTNDYVCNSGCEYRRTNIVNTFNYALVTQPSFKLWIAPRINLALMARDSTTEGTPSQNYSTDGSNSYYESSLEIGLAGAVGANIAIFKHVTLSIDLDYREAVLNGSFEDDRWLINTGDISGKASGFTTRFYLFFKFGESAQTGAKYEKAI